MLAVPPVLECYTGSWYKAMQNSEANTESDPTSPGTLYLVGTPIGNLEDITLRALQTLKEVDLIACEDTRHTAKLLNHYGIEKPTLSYHEHNELTRAAEVVVHLERGDNVAVVSDAGMPGVSDPGYRLVALAFGIIFASCRFREHQLCSLPWSPAACPPTLSTSEDFCPPSPARDELRWRLSAILPGRKFSTRPRIAL